MMGTLVVKGLRRDSYQTKFERRHRILVVKLNFRELCDSKFCGLRAFDNYGHFAESRKGKNQKGRSSRSQMFFQIGALKKFGKFHRKILMLESLFNKVSLLKRDSNVSVFL